MQEIPDTINNPGASGAARLAALAEWEGKNAAHSGGFARENGEINNHIHTVYSFSPYTPAMAALRAREAGLCAAGSVDHDSIAAAEEMLAACAVLGIGGCVGFELRVSFKKDASGGDSPFAGRKINNPDSAGLAYMTVQGVPRQSLKRAAEFLAPLREERLRRTRAMADAANAALHEAGFAEIDFEQDILARSQYAAGGGITERHLLAAVAEKCILRYGKGRELAEALQAKLGVTLSPKIAALLSDSGNPHYLFDVLGLLKSEFLPSVFVQSGERECVPAQTVTAFAESIGAIPAYAYLGDVRESPTGDKRAEKFEDDYIEELFAELSRLGYRAVAYMPPRNTAEQLRNLRRLCAQWGFMEISGVDINSSRQSFNCPEVLRPEFRHLLDTTWALVAHERLASADSCLGLFSTDNPLASLSLAGRIAAYASVGKSFELRHPGESATAVAIKIKKGELS